MTQKEKKQLLLLELCSRLPYGVKGLHRGQVHELFTIDSREANNACIQVDEYNAWFSIDTFKPYLRSLSSMTEEEKQYIRNRWCYEDWYDINDFLNHYQIEAGDSFYFIEWLYEQHFDFRNLIERKLAIEITEENNPYKNDI